METVKDHWLLGVAGVRKGLIDRTQRIFRAVNILFIMSQWLIYFIK